MQPFRSARRMAGGAVRRAGTGRAALIPRLLRPTCGPASILTSMSTIEQTAFVDDLWVPIRIVASPIRGVFRAHPDVHAEDAPMLRPGQPVGIVDGAGGAHVV